jgi:hypothetical protein
LKEFVAEYFPHGEANATRNLIVGLKRENEARQDSLNLLMLLDNCKHAPGLRIHHGNIHCDCESCRVIHHNISTMFAMRKNSKLETWLESRVVCVMLHSSCDIEFEMKNNNLDPWMWKWNNGDLGDGPKPQELQDWEAKTGLKLSGDAIYFSVVY